MSKWTEFDPAVPLWLDRQPGCYVIFFDVTPKFSQRAISHGAAWFLPRVRNMGRAHFAYGAPMTPWDMFDWCHGLVTGKVRYTRRVGEHLALEARLIKRLQPQFNIRGR
jgi:hypothetical protein